MEASRLGLRGPAPGEIQHLPYGSPSDNLDGRKHSNHADHDSVVAVLAGTAVEPAFDLSDLSKTIAFPISSWRKFSGPGRKRGHLALASMVLPSLAADISAHLIETRVSIICHLKMHTFLIAVRG